MNYFPSLVQFSTFICVPESVMSTFVRYLVVNTLIHITKGALCLFLYYVLSIR